MTAPSVFFLPGRDGLPRWSMRLQAALPLTATIESHACLHLYDSFDGRLYRAGLLLEVEPLDGGERWGLRLRSRQNFGIRARVQLDAPLPPMADGLPAGALRSQLHKRLKLRALLPLAELRVRRIELLQRDDEGKTRVRLYLEEFRLVDPNAAGSPLLARWLRIEPLRGYGREAHALRDALQQAFSLPCGDGDLVQRVHLRLGTAPDEQAFRQAPVLTPELRADEAVQALLGHLLAVIEANEAGTIARLDTEFLHDLRVAVRSLRALLRQLKSLFSPGILARLSEDFAWLGGVTGPARDLDVLLLQFDELAALLPAAQRHDLEPLRGFLEGRRQAEYEALARELRSPRYRGLKRRLQNRLARPLAARPAAQDARKPIGEVARRRTWRMYRRVLREGRAIGPDSPPEDVHELRKSCKKLRYLMHFFQDLYAKGKVQEAIQELKRLQDNLGAFQDLDVQLQLLADLSAQMQHTGTGDAKTRAAMAALRSPLEARKVQVRAEFAARFQRFSRERNQRRYLALFHS